MRKKLVTTTEVTIANRVHNGINGICLELLRFFHEFPLAFAEDFYKHLLYYVLHYRIFISEDLMVTFSIFSDFRSSSIPIWVNLASR